MAALSDESSLAFSARAVRAAYDSVATDYTASFAGDLPQLPVERLMLDTALAECPGDGRSIALDLGCGPATVAAYLADNGAWVVGVDLSSGMLAEASHLYPDLALVQGDLRWLPVASSSASLAVAYFSIQHLPRPEVPTVLAEVRRVLVPGGVFVLATHLGTGEVYFDEFLGHDIDTVGGALYEKAELVSLVTRAGFGVDLERQRGPLPHEAQTERIFLLCRSEV